MRPPSLLTFIYPQLFLTFCVVFRDDRNREQMAVAEWTLMALKHRDCYASGRVDSYGAQTQRLLWQWKSGLL
jgi:hypothetical protein